MLCVILMLFTYFPPLFFVFSTSVVVLSFSCGGQMCNLVSLFAP
jgi:hypothetical protein